MAAVDKLYGNRQEYDDFWNWCKKHNPDLLQSFYEWGELQESGAMTNFSVEEDLWLLKNYPDQDVKDKIKNCYSCSGVSDDDVIRILENIESLDE